MSSGICAFLINESTLRAFSFPSYTLVESYMAMSSWLPMRFWNMCPLNRSLSDRQFCCFKTELIMIHLMVDPSDKFHLEKITISNPFRPFPAANFNPHLAFLVDSREIIIMPMSNAYGYYKGVYVLSFGANLQAPRAAHRCEPRFPV